MEGVSNGKVRVEPVEAEGVVTMPHEVGSEREIIVFGSSFAEDGKRSYTNEVHLHSPAGSGDELPPPDAHRNCIEGEAKIQRPQIECGR